MSKSHDGTVDRRQFLPDAAATAAAFAADGQILGSRPTPDPRTLTRLFLLTSPCA